MGEVQHMYGRKAERDEISQLVAEARRRMIASNRPGHARIVEAIYRGRRIRDATFGSDAVIFGEPAWDMMLDLYMAELAGRRLSVSSACIGASVPTTTAMRHLAILESHGLIERTRDESDGRRSFVALSARGVRMMDSWLERAVPNFETLLEDG